MARPINEIQQSIIDDLITQRPDLSPMVAKRKPLTYVVATAIHLFEVILDKFRYEIDVAADNITSGTLSWYVDQCKRFQNGHELLFDENTLRLYYAEKDPLVQIIDAVSITEANGLLSVKVAKLNEQNKIVPLSIDELNNFTMYLNSIKMAGISILTSSTDADKVHYDAQVFYNPKVPIAIVQQRVEEALGKFRLELSLNSTLYTQRFIDAIMSVPDVMTVELKSLRRKGNSMIDFEAVGIADVLDAGYFDYTDDSVLSFTILNQSNNG